MLDLQTKGEPVDLVTVCALLKDRGQLKNVGGPDMRGEVFLATLSEQVGYATNGPYYARLVHEKAVLRRLLDCTREISSACLSPVENVGDFLQLAESKIFDVTSSNGFRKSKKPDFEKIITPARDFTKIEFPPKKTILFPWVSECSIIMIYGPRGVGKTMFVIGLLDAITSGATFGPWETITPTRCLYLDGEMPAQDTAERFNFWANGNRAEQLFIYSDAHAHSLGIPGANLFNEKWRQAMQEILLRKGIRLWVVDNLASLAPGIDENSKQEFDPVNQWFLELRAAGITTIFLHHANKDGGQRGTSGRGDALDISLLLERPKNYSQDQGARFVAKFEKARIRHKDLHLIGDTEFSMETAEDGSYIWTFGSLKKQAKAEVVRMLDEGLTGKDIAAGLGITAARVSQIRREALKDGLISDAGKLTQSGFLWLQKF